MKKLYNIILAVLLLSFLSSCEKQLDQVNPNVLTVDQFWQTESDFDKGLVAAYSGLQFPAISGTTQAHNVMRTDFCGTETWYSIHLSASNMSWTDATTYVEDFWSQPYIGIFRANQVLHYIDQPETDDIEGFTDFEKFYMKAQARFIRGYLYFELLKNFNGAVIQNELPASDEDLRKPFAPKEEVLNTMVYPDLYFAYQVLQFFTSEEAQAVVASEPGRITWGAAASMLGKVYLHQAEWDSASKYLGEVIESGMYELAYDQMDNFTEEGEYNEESIFEIGFTDQEAENIAGDRHDDILANAGGEAQSIASPYAALFAGGYNTNLPTYWLQELFTVADTIDRANEVNQIEGGVYRNGLAAPEERTRSNRTYASIVLEFGDGIYYGDPLSPTVEVESPKLNPNFGQGSKIKKYTNWYKVPNEVAQPENARSGINWRAIRLADVYLMYAEAILMSQGDAALDEALDYVDLVRERAGTFPLSYYRDRSGGAIPQFDVSPFARETEHELNKYPPAVLNSQSLLQHIKTVERPLELCFEGHRWNDLVRWGMVREVFEDRRAEELILIERLGSGGGDPAIPVPADGSSEKYYPLYLNEHVRIDFEIPLDRYIAGDPNGDGGGQGHDYFYVPSLEIEANNNF